MNPQVDQFLLEGCMRCSKGGTPACKVHLWTPILEQLRQVLLETELVEERKWGVPTYTLNGKNVIMLGVFNDSCVLSFLKGILIEDPKGLLEFPGPNSQQAKVLRFTDLTQVKKWKKDIPEFISQAIQIENQGKKVESPRQTGSKIPKELIQKFEEHEGLEKAFFALTPGRQRGYLIHLSGAKQSATRLSRIEKCIPKILAGKGMMD
ncbi:YdeI family protein [Algoriphagus sp. oki45]|uniref:YdeI/OmpD-associated family protein n=1 Tax=Algoriphagus sp. oki45 TaxID=3067294 RepID=UPI0027E813E7|nr:YdeI family protein [Algoriphagus sp. oki45]